MRSQTEFPSVHRLTGGARTTNDILMDCARAFRIPLRVFKDPNVARVYSHPRYAAMKLLSEERLMTLSAIAKVFGKRDHTTIVHGLRQADKLIETDAEFAAAYNKAKAHAGTKPEEPIPQGN